MLRSTQANTTIMERKVFITLLIQRSNRWVYLRVSMIYHCYFLPRCTTPTAHSTTTLIIILACGAMSFKCMEFLPGIVIVADMSRNGQPWPYFQVEPRKYRFRLLNAAVSRTFDLTFGTDAGDLLDFDVIASDGGKISKLSFYAPR